MFLRNLLIVSISVLLVACGSGSDQLDIPSERPMGAIQGNVLGGLYSGGTITAYTLNQYDKRQYLADSTIQENGNFELQFTSISQPILLEARGGNYLDPVSKKSIGAEPEFIMSTTLAFQSGEVHKVIVTPFSHLATGLVLYKLESEKINPNKINLEQAVKEIDELFSIRSYGQQLEITLQEDQNTFLIKGDEKHGLLIDALSQMANDESTSKQDSLQALYSLSSLNSLMYEDIRSDGQLNGKSIQIDGSGEKLLAFGDLKISQDFYRLNLAMAVKRSFEHASLEVLHEKSEQDNFVLFLAETQNGLLGEINNNSLETTVPVIKFNAIPAKTVKGNVALDFSIENALKLQTVKVTINELEVANFNKPSEETFSVSINSTEFVDGQHEIAINVIDSYENTASLQLSLVFDNSPPAIEVHSSNLTKHSNFVIDGSFSDAYSKIKKISVNGEDATITNKQWSKSVSLNSGLNEFVINIEDELGNSRELNTQITLDDSGAGIKFTSAALTNTSHFTLQGEFHDALSAITRITVNGVDADITGSSTWSFPVVLSSGNNQFIVGVSDLAGNYNEISTQVVLDELAPIVKINSLAVTKDSNYLLQGEYNDELSAVTQITVNGELATLVDEKTWNMPVTLSGEKNEYIIGVSDDAGNYTEFSTWIVLDVSAPVVRVTSSVLTNNNSFTLEGEYEELLSSVVSLVVNGSEATLLPDQKWSHAVDLASGDNSFVIGIEDEAGNYSEITSHVMLDKVVPQALITSTLLTNQTPFILTGTYSDNISEIDTILVSGENAILTDKSKWTKSLILNPGENEFAVRIVDKAGNFSENTITVVLDDLPPVINFNESVQARFSGNDGSHFSSFLELKNSVPFYIETSQLSLSGMEANKKNLVNEKIPYFSFNLIDQPLDGLETSPSDLKIVYRYMINNTEIVPWQGLTLKQSSNEIILPVVAETLSNAWYKTDPDDNHTLEIKVSDKAGNVTIEQVTFKAQFYVPDLKVALNNELDSIKNGTFAKRAEYINADVVSYNYSFTNNGTRNYRIRISDGSIHKLKQIYEEIQRQNKVQLQSKESWRRSTITDLEASCPQLNHDWQSVSALWNRLGGEWVKTLPETRQLEIIDVDTDNPVPPATTAWKDYQTSDKEYYSYFSSLEGETLSYNFDYIFNYDTVSLHTASRQPGMVKAWNLKPANGAVITCSDLKAIQTKNEFSYLKVDGYPRNNLISKDVSKEFSTSRIKLYDQDNKEIVNDNGWYNIPAGHKITIKKYVRTPNITLYTDSKVASPATIKDYNLHKYDKSLNWSISPDLHIDTQFNPDGLLEDAINIKSQQVSIPAESIVFQR